MLGCPALFTWFGSVETKGLERPLLAESSLSPAKLTRGRY